MLISLNNSSFRYSKFKIIRIILKLYVIVPIKTGKNPKKQTVKTYTETNKKTEKIKKGRKKTDKRIKTGRNKEGKRPTAREDLE